MSQVPPPSRQNPIGILDQIGQRLALSIRDRHESRIGLRHSTITSGPVSSATGPATEFLDAFARIPAVFEIGHVCHGALLNSARAIISKRIEGSDQSVGFIDLWSSPADSRLGFRFASACLGAVAQPLSGVFRSWAILSETCLRPSIKASIRSSIALRLTARRSSSSPLRRRPGNRRVRSPAMIRCAVTVIASNAHQQCRATKMPPTSPAPAQIRNEPSGGIGDDADQTAPCFQVAADENAEPARQESATCTSARRLLRLPRSSSRLYEYLQSAGRVQHTGLQLADIAVEILTRVSRDDRNNCNSGAVRDCQWINTSRARRAIVVIGQFADFEFNGRVIWPVISRLVFQAK